MMSKKIRFLLVEDNEDHAQLVLREMNAVGGVDCEISHVPDGEKALAFLQQQGEYADVEQPDIVLLDLKLPKVDGHEVLIQMKQNPDLRPIPVIILTTSEAKIDRDKAYLNYANSYLVKPLDFTQFHDLVLQLINYWGSWNRFASEPNMT